MKTSLLKKPTDGGTDSENPGKGTSK